jgi:catechol 2,3-dioxygenase-like lactoylglutathione lyase family enzyme
MSAPGPVLAGVLETTLYYDRGQREAMESLYAKMLGLAVVGRWGDGTALRLGTGVVLLFEREGLAGRSEPLADHGTTGPGHVCLSARPGDYEAWKGRVREAGVEITHEEGWPGDGHSFYFKDPAGNLLEIADRDIWPDNP